MAAMATWEYARMKAGAKTAKVSGPDGHERDYPLATGSADPFMLLLTQFGEQGWEAYAVADGVVYLKHQTG